MAEYTGFDLAKVRDRLSSDHEEIVSKRYSAARMRDLADEEERDAIGIELRRRNFADLLFERSSGHLDYFDVEDLLAEFGLFPTSSSDVTP
ncbi:MAG TPA: hypothetical protein VN108_10445 [Marmoricola sp.]|nr:hypothetical protein [Marmoricola sp.]